MSFRSAFLDVRSSSAAASFGPFVISLGILAVGDVTRALSIVVAASHLRLSLYHSRDGFGPVADR